MDTLDSGATPAKPCRESFWLLVVIFSAAQTFGGNLLVPLLFFTVALLVFREGLRDFPLVCIEWVI